MQTQILDDNGELQTVEVVVVADGAILSTIWNVTPPNPELFGLAQIGADSNGISTSLTYHIVGTAGSKAWVATGGTVKNLYGGV